MKTDRLVVRKFRRNDVHDLYRLLSDPDVMRYIEPVYSMEQTAVFLNAAGLREPPMIFAVDDMEGNFIGYVIYHPYEKDSFEIGWILLKHQWGKGYAQELTRALMADAKGKTKYLVLECAPAQTVTRRIALRNHFVYAGRENGCDVYKLELER